MSVITCRDRGGNPTLGSEVSNRVVKYFPSLGDIAYGFSFGALYQLMTDLRAKDRTTDIVWFGGVWNLLTILGPIICRLLSVKYVITPHGMLVPQLISLKSSGPKKLVLRLFLKRNLEKAHKVHFTVGQEILDTQQATGAIMRPVVFPLCFNLRRFESGITVPEVGSPNDKIVLSFIGRITPKKRIDLIISALKKLPSGSKSKLSFRVIGTDSEGLWDEAMYTEKNTGVPIEYVGPLYGEALVAAFNSTDIFVLCSESENFAISVVEAAYCYSALLISKEVGVSEYFLESSAVYARLVDSDISVKIGYLIEDPRRLHDYKLAARKVSEQFDSYYLTANYFQDLLS